MRILLIAATPVVVFLSHLLWSITIPFRSLAEFNIMPPPLSERILAHFVGEGLWLGASYALAGAFIIFALGRFRDRRREALAGVAGGTLLAGGIYAFGCFMLGCCGSPMAVVWLSLLGGRFANVGGLFLFLLTLLSISVGLWMLNRRERELSASYRSVK
jgi:hypothetical protein